MPTIPLPVVYLARHGETEWAAAGRHTGRTDIPLTEHGQTDARRLGARLAGRVFARVWTSPAERAKRTCELAGYGPVAELDPDLWEWDYGEYEGRTSADIRAVRPDWRLFRDGCPGGESPADVAARADHIVARVRSAGGDVLLFSSGHISRVLAARWLGLDPAAGALFMLGTGALCILGYDHDLTEPAVRLWNDRSHLGPLPEPCG
ncbi:MAG TPA: histidine phosphatase family protein [Gemmataceae bacterium]|nr:histidine phosphatase family protein [Gemmataceae bacterium]